MTAMSLSVCFIDFKIAEMIVHSYARDMNLIEMW